MCIRLIRDISVESAFYPFYPRFIRDIRILIRIRQTDADQVRIRMRIAKKRSTDDPCNSLNVMDMEKLQVPI